MGKASRQTEFDKMTKETQRLRQEAGSVHTEFNRRIELLQAEVSRERHRAMDASDQLTRESASLLESQRQFRMSQEKTAAEALEASAAAEARSRAQDELAEARKKLAAKEALLETPQ